MYSTFNEGKAVVIERFNRTLKNITWKYFTANNTRFYLDALDKLVKNYNDKNDQIIIIMIKYTAQLK